jgi:hypothetical protein
LSKDARGGAYAVALAPCLALANFKGRVVKVSDGDTLIVLVNKRQVKVRLESIDAPESKQAFGKRSQQSLAQLCTAKTAKRARQWFEWAHRICFLGFGFDPLNMERLGLYSLLRDKRQGGSRTTGSVYATTYGRTNAAKDADRYRLLGEEVWRTYDMPSTSMLRESGLLIPERRG